MGQQKTKAELEDELYRLCCKGKAEEIWDWVLENCTLKAIPLDAEVKVNFADINKIINESMETAKLEMDASEHPSVYSYFEGQISVLETLQHKLSKISA